MINAPDPKFLEFLEIYERAYTMPRGLLKSPHIPSLLLDAEAESLLDDLGFLLTNELKYQDETRKKLRKFISEIAQERLNSEIK